MSITIKIGTYLEIGEHIFRVVERLAENNLIIRRIIDGETRTVTISEILQGYADKTIRLNIKRQEVLKAFDDLSTLPDLTSPEERDYLARMNAFLSEIVLTKCKRTDAALNRLILDVAARNKFAHWPSATTLRRTFNAWTEAGRTNEILLAIFRLKSRRTNPIRCKFPGEVTEIFGKLVEDEYLVREKCSIRGLHTSLKKAIKKRNEENPWRDQLPTPSLKWVQTQVKKIPKYDIHRGHHGRDSAETAFAAYGSLTPPERPLEFVQIDHTKADVLVYILHRGKRMPVGRPWITVAIDVCTRMVAGVHVGFEPPSSLSVANCLYSAIMPKIDLLNSMSLDPRIWPVCGVPAAIETDNGKEFRSEWFREACAHFGITHILDEVRRPQSKPYVERFFGTLNRFIHRLPGTTFSNPTKRGNYKSRKEVAIEFDQFRKMILRFIAETYHQDLHTGIGIQPLRLWHKLVTEFPTLPANPADLIVLTAPARYPDHSLTGRGIELFYLRYQSDQLKEIRRQLGDTKVLARVNPNDIGSVFVLNPLDDTYVQVPCTRQDVAAGLSIPMLKVLKTIIADNGEVPCEDSFLRAKDCLSELFEKTLGKSRTVADAQRLARYLSIGTAPLEIELLALDANDELDEPGTDVVDGYMPATTPLPIPPHSSVAFQIEHVRTPVTNITTRPDLRSL
jgi:putative transposase